MFQGKSCFEDRWTTRPTNLSIEATCRHLKILKWHICWQSYQRTELGYLLELHAQLWQLISQLSNKLDKSKISYQTGENSCFMRQIESKKNNFIILIYLLKCLLWVFVWLVFQLILLIIKVISLYEETPEQFRTLPRPLSDFVH